MKYLSVAEYAKMAGLSVPTVYRKIEKELKKYAKKVDGKWKISSHALSVLENGDSQEPEKGSNEGALSVLIDEKDLIIADLKARLEGKEEIINSLRELISSQKSQIQAQQTQIEDLTRALETAQQIANTSKAQLAIVSAEKAPWWNRLFQKRK